MNVSIIHCSSKIVFLILNCLTFYLHACHVSENTVYKVLGNDSFWGDNKEVFFLYALCYTELDFGIVFICKSLCFLPNTYKNQ
jgi:hypothetical protein